MTVATIGLISKARRKILDHFLLADAVSPESAIRFVPEDHWQDRQFAQFQERAIVRPVGIDRYWIDVPRYRRWENLLRLRVLIVAGAALAMFALLAR